MKKQCHYCKTIKIDLMKGWASFTLFSTNNLCVVKNIQNILRWNLQTINKVIKHISHQRTQPITGSISFATLKTNNRCLNTKIQRVIQWNLPTLSTKPFNKINNTIMEFSKMSILSSHKMSGCKIGTIFTVSNYFTYLIVLLIVIMAGKKWI